MFYDYWLVKYTINNYICSDMKEAMWLVALRTQATYLTARQLFSLLATPRLHLHPQLPKSLSPPLLTLLVDSATFRHVQ